MMVRMDGCLRVVSHETIQNMLKELRHKQPTTISFWIKQTHPDNQEMFHMKQ